MDDLNKKEENSQSEDDSKVLGDEMSPNAGEEKLNEDEKNKVNEILQNLKTKNEDEEAKGIQDWEGLVDTQKEESEILGEDVIINDDIELSQKETNYQEELAEEIDEGDLCILCGERRRYTEIDEDYMYCKVCRDKMKKTHMNPWGVLTVLFAVIIGFCSLVMGVYAIATAIPIFKGDHYMRQGKYTSAINAYTEAEDSVSALNTEIGLDEGLFETGLKTKGKLVECYVKNDGFSQIQNYVDIFKDLNKIESRKLASVLGYIDLYNDIISTDETFSADYSEMFNNVYSQGKKLKVTDIKEQLATLEKLKSDKKYNKAIITYYQYLLCSLVSESDAEQEKYLLEVKSYGSEYSFVYSANLCNFYLSQGEYEKSDAVCKEALKNSSENLSAYQYLMISKRRSGDYDGALKIGAEAAKKGKEIYTVSQTADDGTVVTPSAVPDAIPMEDAICYALKGDMKKALSSIEEAYSINSTSNDTLNIYMMLHYLSHVDPKAKVADGAKVDTVDGGYDTALSTIQQYAQYYSSYFYISENVQAVMDGKKSLEDVFVKGEVAW